ncbi:MAG TPA: hypothetical protein PLC88_09625, partial [Syntrophomonas sp.]|nr:hypothetical protein [Syntrophomonas sp.]HRW12533.1 hypothetical protein [Syntrophomonas sp.]
AMLVCAHIAARHLFAGRLSIGLYGLRQVNNTKKPLQGWKNARIIVNAERNRACQGKRVAKQHS